MEALEKEREEMEAKFTIHQHDVDKLKEQEVKSKLRTTLRTLYCVYILVTQSAATIKGRASSEMSIKYGRGRLKTTFKSHFYLNFKLRYFMLYNVLKISNLFSPHSVFFSFSLSLVHPICVPFPIQENDPLKLTLLCR